MEKIGPALVLYSPAMEKLARFYGRLGWEFVKERHDGGPEHLACDFGGFTVEVYPSAQAFPGSGMISGSRLVIPVDDVDAAVKAVARLGGVLVRPKDSTRGRAALVADPDGRHVLLVPRTGS